MWHHHVMDTDEAGRRLDSLAASYRRAEKRLDDVRDELAEAIADALRAGMKQSEVERRTPYQREHIRRIARAHGIPPAR